MNNNIHIKEIHYLYKMESKPANFIIEDDDEKIEVILNENENEEKEFLDTIDECIKLYFHSGPRSSKKVDCLHGWIKSVLDKFIQLKEAQNTYKVLLEQNVPSLNESGKKRCDIVLYKNEEPYILFPVKFIMTNYKQNKNNSWECLTGEVLQLKWVNPSINIIPINIFMDKTPYLNKGKIITKFEKISYQDIKIYEILKEKNLAYDIINYILCVDHVNNIGEKYDTLPNILTINSDTKYRTFDEILQGLF